MAGNTEVVKELTAQALRSLPDKRLVKLLQHLSERTAHVRSISAPAAPLLKQGCIGNLRPQVVRELQVDPFAPSHVNLPRFWHWKSRVNKQDEKSIRWREHVSNAHFIRWRLDKLHQQRLKAAAERKAAVLKDDMWQQQQQHQQVLSAAAFADWLSNRKAHQPGTSVPLKAKARYRRRTSSCASSGSGMDDLLAHVRNTHQNVVGRQAGSCFLQQLYRRHQQEIMWNSNPLSAMERKRFMFDKSVQQGDDGIPAWKQPGVVALPLVKQASP